MLALSGPGKDHQGPKKKKNPQGTRSWDEAEAEGAHPSTADSAGTHGFEEGHFGQDEMLPCLEGTVCSRHLTQM